MVLLNENNFLRWFDTTPILTDRDEYGDEGQYADINNPAISFVAGDILSFYANLDTPTSKFLPSATVDLVKKDGSIVVSEICDISVIGSTTYRFYCDEVIIPDVTYGCYYFDVKISGITELVSSSFIIGNGYRTKLVRWRNNKNILNFGYESLPSFFNQFRISLTQRHPTPKTRRIGYELVNGSFNPVRTTLGNDWSFITGFFNDKDHSAFNAMTIQEIEIYDEITASWKSYKRSDQGDYDIEWNDNFPLAQGTIKLEDVASYSTNRNI